MQYIENESFYSAFDILLVVVSIELFTFGVFFAVIPFNRKDYWSIAIVFYGTISGVILLYQKTSHPFELVSR